MLFVLLLFTALPCSTTTIPSCNALQATAADWPQWRGPLRDGISRESGWRTEAKAKDLWRVNVGLGYSSVSIAHRLLYTMGYDADLGLDVVFCLDAFTGEVVWDFAYPAEIWNYLHRGGTLTTPSVHGDVVFTVNREGNFFCFDAKTGEVRASRNLVEELGVEPPTWGFAASPLVLENSLILNLGRVVALDPDTLKVRWVSENYGHAYSTPMDFELDGKPCLAVFNGKGLVVLDRATGEELYAYEWKTRQDINVATPIVDGRRIFISSGLNHGCAMVELRKEDVSVVWESKVMRNYMSGCVLHEGHLYGFDETIFKCVDLQGDEQWRLRGDGRGAFLLAGDRLILADSGDLIIAKAIPEEYAELSRTTLFEDGENWTPPVLVGGLMYVRNNLGELVCRDHREP